MNTLATNTPTGRNLKGSAFSLWLVLALFSSASLPALASDNPTERAKIFLHDHFAATSPTLKTLWVNNELRERVETVLGHRFAGLRVRYWQADAKTAWILDEIGKEQPITIGVVINNGKIAAVEILAYRETRGGEVRYPFFTQQFQALELQPDNSDRLSKHIDGITGATLSVAAVRKTATVALILHQNTPTASHLVAHDTK